MSAELRTFVDIEAPAERVWDVLTDLPAYEDWNPFITRAEGTLTVGSRVTFRLLPVNAFVRPTLRPVVLELIPCQRLSFRSRMDRLGLLEVEHIVTLTPQDGGVRLWQDAHFRGLLVRPLIGPLNRARGSAFHAMNTALKERSEGRQADAPAAEG